MMRGAVVFGVLMMLAAGPAQAGCREDLVTADQNLHRTRSNLHQAVNAAPAVKCAAYRRHIGSLTQIRAVFAKCDTSADKTKNAAQATAAIAEFTRQASQTCKDAPPAAAKAPAAKPAPAPAPSLAPPPPLPVPR
jgi:hypothetical protein